MSGKQLYLLLSLNLLLHPLAAQVQRVDIPANQFAFTFQEDGQGRVWIGLSDGATAGGLGVYGPGGFELLTGGADIPTGSFHTSLSLPDGSLLFGGFIVGRSGYPMLVWVSDMGIDTIAMPFALANPLVNSLTLVDRRYIWIGTASGLLVNRMGQWARYTTREGLPHMVVNAVRQDIRGAIWVATEGGMVSFIEGRLVPVARAARVIGSVSTLYSDSRGYLWAGDRFTSEGISVYNGALWDTFTAGQGLADNSVSTIFEDRLGNLWVGSCYSRTRGGLSRFDGRRWSAFLPPAQLAKPCVDALGEDAQGRLWIGGSLSTARGRGITLFDGGRRLTLTPTGALPAERVIAFFRDSRRRLWVSSFEGLYIIPPDFALEGQWTQ